MRGNAARRSDGRFDIRALSAAAHGAIAEDQPVPLEADAPLNAPLFWEAEARSERHYSTLQLRQPQFEPALPTASRLSGVLNRYLADELRLGRNRISSCGRPAPDPKTQSAEDEWLRGSVQQTIKIKD